MPNRIIKESICVSEQIDELSPFEETFFYRLLVNCDDYGCMDAREKVLAAKLFPLKTIRAKEIMNAVKRLAQIGLVGLYEVEEKPYLKVLKWSDHQRVRISKHRYPEPTEEQLNDSRGNLRQLAATCGELRRDAANGGNLRPESNPIQSESNNESISESVSESESNARAHDDFDRFWLAYPRHEAKQNALKAFEKINPDGELLERIIEAVERWKKTEQWTEKGGQFVPYAASWLNGRRWEDEIPEKRKAGPVKVVVAQDYDQRSYDDIQSQIDADMEQEMERWRQSRGGA